MCIPYFGNWVETAGARKREDELELQSRVAVLLGIPYSELPSDIEILKLMLAEAKSDQRLERQQMCKPNYSWTTIEDAIEKRRRLGKIFPDM